MGRVAKQLATAATNGVKSVVNKGIDKVKSKVAQVKTALQTKVTKVSDFFNRLFKKKPSTSTKTSASIKSSAGRGRPRR